MRVVLPCCTAMQINAVVGPLPLLLHTNSCRSVDVLQGQSSSNENAAPGSASSTTILPNKTASPTSSVTTPSPRAPQVGHNSTRFLTTTAKITQASEGAVCVYVPQVLSCEDLFLNLVQPAISSPLSLCVLYTSQAKTR